MTIGALAVATALLGTPAQATTRGGAATGSVDSAPATVMAVTSSNGVTDITLYTPVAGVGAERLYQMLQARGVPGLRQPRGTGAHDRNTSVTSGMGFCGYGTATAMTCPTAHWARNGFAHPQVYFIDKSSSAWPVAAAVPPWNQAHGVDSLYRYGTCPATAGIHCVTTTNGSFGDTGWDGRTNMQIDANHNFVDGMSIDFNDSYQETPSQHLTATCHELGHALGLDHNSSTNSCMFAGGSDSATTPAADDYTLLADIYSSF